MIMGSWTVLVQLCIISFRSLCLAGRRGDAKQKVLSEDPAEAEKRRLKPSAGPYASRAWLSFSLNEPVYIPSLPVRVKKTHFFPNDPLLSNVSHQLS